MTNLRTIAVCLLLASAGYGAEKWSVGATQRDPGSLQEMLERLAAGGAQIWRDGARFLIEGDLRDLPRETGVQVEPWAAALASNLSRAKEFSPEGTLSGKGTVVTLDHAENAVFLGTSFLLDRVEGVAWGADGTVILDSAYASGSSARALNFARQFGLRVTMVETAQAKYELKRPRLGLATRQPWVAELLDRYNVPYAKAESMAFDTILFDCGDARTDNFARGGGTSICVPEAMGVGFERIILGENQSIAFGMPRETWARTGTGSLETGVPIVRFAASHRTGVAEEKRGKGSVVSFAFRADTYATCKLLLNAIYLGSARRL